MVSWGMAIFEVAAGPCITMLIPTTDYGPGRFRGRLEDVEYVFR
jgi:hypothetical protein